MLKLLSQAATPGVEGPGDAGGDGDCILGGQVRHEVKMSVYYMSLYHGIVN